MKNEAILILVTAITPFLVEMIKSKLDKRYIPLLSAGLGAILAVVGHFFLGLDFIIVEALITGLIAGLAGTGIHQAQKQMRKEVKR